MLDFLLKVNADGFRRERLTAVLIMAERKLHGKYRERNSFTVAV
jgi:hypothetical protein